MHSDFNTVKMPAGSEQRTVEKPLLSEIREDHGSLGKEAVSAVGALPPAIDDRNPKRTRDYRNMYTAEMMI